MITLNSVNDILELVTSSSATIAYDITYNDMIPGVSALSGSTSGTISSATTTTILSNPAEGTTRSISYISIRNAHASTLNNVTVQKDISGTNYELTPPVDLAHGEVLQYEDDYGWKHLDIDGNLAGGGGGGASLTTGQESNVNSYPFTLSTEQDAKLDSIDSNLGSINSSTSELPAQTSLLTDIDSKLNDIKGYTDQIEAGISSTNGILADGTQRTLIEPRTATGNITTQNLVPAGVATAGSAVELDVSGYSGAIVQVTGTHTGALSLQYTVDGATWVTGASCFFNVSGTTAPTNIITSAANGIFRIPTFGAKKIRVTGLAAMTGTTVVTIISSAGSSYLDAGNITSIISSVAISSTGGSAYLVKNEDTAAATGDAGIATWRVRRDTLTVSASATGDYNEMASTKYGAGYVKDEERQKATYSFSCEFTPAASATDILEIKASGTKTITIQVVEVYAFATAATVQPIDLLRRSTLNTGGTRTAVTAIKHEEADAAATAAVNFYTANPTTGTLVGKLRAMPVYFAAAAGTAEYQVKKFNLGELNKPLVLAQNSTQSFVLNIRGSTPSGAVIAVNITITEE